jgi:hypothetical protein
MGDALTAAAQKIDGEVVKIADFDHCGSTAVMVHVSGTDIWTGRSFYCYNLLL